MEALSERNAQEQAAQTPEESQLHKLQQCLQAVSMAAVDGDGPKIRVFENGQECSSPEKAPPKGDLNSWLEQFVKTLESLAQNGSRISFSQVRELQTTLMLMGKTIAMLADAARGAVSGLAEVESTLENSGAVDDLRELRGKLERCLSMARTQSEQLRLDLEQKVQALQSAVEKVAALAGRPAIDATTNLPGRESAENAIAARISEGQPAALALVIVDRLAFLNAKFGGVVKDEVLASAARHIAQNLPPGTSMFRWSGPAFAAVFEARHGFTAVEREVKKAATSRLEQTVDAGGRSVLLTISRSHHLWRLDATTSPQTIFQSLDDFIAANSADASRAS
jgi:GGDEF domain-containing protein